MSSLPLFLGQNYDGILIQGHKEMGLEQASLRVRCMNSTGTARAWSTHTPKTHTRSQPQDISPNREIHTAESTVQCRKAVDKLTQLVLEEHRHEPDRLLVLGQNLLPDHTGILFPQEESCIVWRQLLCSRTRE